MFLFGIIIILITLVFYGQLLQTSTTRDTLRSNEKLAKEVAHHITTILENKASIAATLSSAPLIEDALEQSNSYFTRLSSDDREQEIKRLNNLWMAEESIDAPFIKPYMTNPVAVYLKKQQALFPGVYGEIFLTNRYGAMIATTNQLTTLAHARKYWWQASYHQGKGRIFFDDRGFDTSVEGYVIGVVIPIKKDGQIIGLLKCNFNIIAPLNNVVGDFNLREPGLLLKIGRTGGLVVFEQNRQPLSTMLPESIIQDLGDNNTSSLIIHDQDTKYITAFSHVSITEGTDEYGFGGKYESIDHIKGNVGEKWHTIIFQKAEFINQLVMRRILDLSIYGIFFSILMALIVLVIGYRVSAPIMKLANGAKQLGKGILDTRISINSRDEIGDLAKSFNIMAKNLKHTMASRDDLAHEVKLRRQTEIELKGSELKYKTLSQKLNESNNMKELLLDIITHDLKNPAGVISNIGEMLLEGHSDYEMLELIKESSDNLLQVIDNVTTLAQVTLGDKIKLEEIDIPEVLHSAGKEFSSQLKQLDMSIVIDIPDKLLIKANPIISEVFRNYISNAIKYASEGKKILIDSDKRKGFLTINVKDFGSTIPENKRQDVFYRSVQLENGKKRGRGLGLAIVKRIAEAHNAEVGVKPNEPAGNIFYIKIPI